MSSGHLSSAEGRRTGPVSFLIGLGPVRGTVLVTAVAVSASLSISLVIMGVLHHVSLMGTLISIGIPAALVPVSWYPFVKVSAQLQTALGKLAQSEDRYRSIMSQASDGIVLLDPDAEPGPVVVEVNHAACTMHGFPKEEMVGLPMSRLDESLTPEKAAGKLEALSKGGVMVFETWHRRRDGSEFPLEVSTRLVSFGGKKYLLSIERDITERKESEKAIREYARKLEHSNQMQELFNDILSHDLLSPASIIASASAHLSAGADEGTAREVDMIVRNCDKLISLVNDAACLAKLESTETLQKEGDDLTRLVAAAVESLQAGAASSKVEIAFDPPGEIPVEVNSVFETALVNVISNAVKFSPEESTVSVDVSEDRGFHCVSVADHGPGIPDALKDLVFRRFTKLDKGGQQGSGLGLAIASRIAYLHGGRIWVENNPGGGSVFRLTVPKMTAADS